MQRNLMIRILIILLVISLLSGCAKKNLSIIPEKREQENNLRNGKVYINGEENEAILAQMHSSSIRLPLLKIVQSLGMGVDQKEDGVYHITKDSNVYILYCDEDILLVKQGGDDWNLLDPPPGVSSFYCQYELGDVYLDDETLASALFLMEVTIHILADYEMHRINIVTP